MISDVTMLVNPASGRGRAAGAARHAATYLRQAGVTVERITGRDEREALDLAKEAAAGGTGALVACGGDGVVNIALQAVAGTSTPYGVIPAGTGNDNARMLGIPLGDPAAAARIVRAGTVRTVDLGRATGAAPQEDRWFGTVVAAGFDAKVNARTNRMSWPRGKWRYNLAILAELAALRPLNYVIDLDGQRLRTRAVLVAVGNGPSYGGGMRVCPAAEIDDGLLDVTVIGPTSPGRLIRLLPTVYTGAHVGYPQVSTYRAQRVSLSTPDITAYADGEPLGELPLTFECSPGAAHALTPPG